MITFDESYTGLQISTTGGIEGVPINSYLRSVHIDKYGVIVMDTSGDWGHIRYQDTAFNSNRELFNYLYTYTLINIVQTKKIEICTDDLHTSNSIPYELVEAPGRGLIINPIAMSRIYKYKSTQYVFSDDLYIHNSTKTDAEAYFMITASVMNAASDDSSVANLITGTSQLVENDSIVIMAKTADPAPNVGDGNLTIYFTYSIVEERWLDGVYCT